MATQPGTQPKVKDLAKPSCTYDQDQIQTFFDTVFHTEETLDHVCAYVTTANPGYPEPAHNVVKRLNGEKPAFACYFGTASMDPDPSGKFYNRQANMRAMHVIVLDDIGTKIPKEKMPKSLDPTYKIETSEGNEQWGLVLETPITDIEEAKLLVKLVYSSGLTDSGGGLCNKIVRLPAGVNGKVHPLYPERSQFKVKLLDMDGPYHTPQSMLDALGINADWEALLADPELVRRQMRRKQGAAVFAKQLDGIGADGVSDEVVHWLYEHKRVLQDGSDWLTINCPWCNEHTSGDKTAGYKPLGRGDIPARRGFKCFHDHCSGRTTQDFLIWVSECGGPQVPARDPHYDLVAKYVYDMASERFFNMTYSDYSVQRSIGLTKASFNDMYPEKAHINLGNKNPIKVNAFEMWKRHESRVVVQGVTIAAGDNMMVRKPNMPDQLNIFSMPEYNRRPHDPKKVEPFKRFIDYLVPVPEERKYFLDWLACKAQNPAFRGNAIVMVAEEQEGTGRGTLGKLIGKIWGPNNIYNTAFNDMFKEFNPFMKAMFVTCDETLMDRSQKRKEEAYERLKSLIEPSEVAITVNEKNEKQYSIYGGPSFLFFSNHADAMYVRGQARRFYVIKNPDTPRLPNGKPDPAIFEMIYAYMETEGWQEEVYNWLLDRDVNEKEMLMPAPETHGKERMRVESGTLSEKVLRAVVEAWSEVSPIMLGPEVKEIYTNLLLRLNPDAKPTLSYNAVRKYHLVSGKAQEGLPDRVRLDRVYSYCIPAGAVDELVYAKNASAHFKIAVANMREAMELDNQLFRKIEEAAAEALDIH